MTELLSELKEACHRGPAESDEDTIARGGSTWFRGVPAHAEEGTVALGLGDVRIIVSERDVRAVTKAADRYVVEVSSEANVLLRIEKTLKAVMQPDCRCGDRQSGTLPYAMRPTRDVEVGPIEVCDLLCADVVVDTGTQSRVLHICIPVNCRVEALQSSG
jgi:hypothetical protein